MAKIDGVNRSAASCGGHRVVADHLVDVQHSVAPAQVGVHVGEQQAGAPGGQAARPVGRVGLEHEPHVRPARRQSQLVVALELFADAVSQRCHRAAPTPHGGGQRVGHGVRRMRGDQVPANDPRGRGPDDCHLIREARSEPHGSRREVVRDGAAWPADEPAEAARRTDERKQQRRVEPVKAPAGRAHPGEVKRVVARVGYRDETAHGFRQRRDAEPRAGQVLDAELEADHLAPGYIHLKAHELAMRSAQAAGL